MTTTDRRDRGQALVEFSLVLIPFLWILMGVVDLGRGIYTYNGVSQAAREIARVTSVHTCATSGTCTLGSSSQTAAVVGTQTKLIPGLGAPGSSIAYTCTTITDAVLSSVSCPAGAYVKVSITVPFSAITPFLGGFLPGTLSSTTHVQIQ